MTLCVIRHINCHFDQLILSAPFSLHGFPAPFRRRFPALPCGVIAGYPMQTVMRFSRCGAGFGNKKSPHNNLNLTIPSGMALVRVCYVAIRKLKTCSGSFGSRAGTLSKYVILNCWNSLPQKSSYVNVNLSGRGPSSCCARPFCRLKAPLGLSLLRCASQTRTFENTLISAACKKTQGKLWQKERGPDGAGPLDRIMRCSKISAAFIAVFKNSAEQNGIFTICSLRILLRWENRIRQKDKVSAGKIRTRQ